MLDPVRLYERGHLLHITEVNGADKQATVSSDVEEIKVQETG